MPVSHATVCWVSTCCLFSENRRFSPPGTVEPLAIVIQMHYIQGMKEVTMASNALVQTRIDADVKEKATAVLENMGLTVSDAVRILLTRTANEGMLPLELVSNSQAYDSWFREKVRQALADPRPDLDDSEVEAHFARRRSANGEACLVALRV